MDRSVLTIMQGIPGSGKSTVAALLAKENQSTIFSTDDFWYRNGPVYEYDLSLIGEAHRWNQLRAVDHMLNKRGNVIIDNTNITRAAAEPYIQLAHIFNYEVHVVRVEVELKVALARQLDRPVDRRVPNDVIARMHDQMEKIL